MADKNIYIETDINNIFLINPNKVYGTNGGYEDRNVPHEELIMYANLECNLQPRSRLITGSDSTDLRQIGVGKINFLKPNNQDYLTTNYTKSQAEVDDANIVNGELLGITAINFKVSRSQTPIVTISLEDSKGRALFEAGNESIYSAFFNLPYPTFYLTLKGYYGKAVRYPLLLTKFASSFNQSTSNFEITLNFIGYQFGVLNDINMGEILALPQMYIRRTTENVGGQFTNLPTLSANATTKFTQKGYEKIQQVYKEYKSKGLINKDFPELTVNQLITVLENFIASKLKSFGSISMNILNDIPKYKEILDNYKKTIITGVSPESWAKTYMDLENPFYYVIESDKGVEFREEIPVYTFKSTDQNIRTTGFGQLVAHFGKFNLQLSNVETFKSGKYAISTVDLNPTTIIYTNPNPQVLLDNAELTFRKRNAGAKPTADQLENLKTQIKNLFPSSNEEENRIEVQPNSILNSLGSQAASGQQQPATNTPTLYSWTGPKEFNEKISQIETKLSEKEEEMQKDLQDKLANLLKSSTNIGFNPTIRNVIAVIMASAEGFLRLMNEVHENAFKERDNPKKKQGVPDDIKGEGYPVYPWPQFAVEKTVNGDKKIEVQYPGDAKYIKLSNANDYKIWPEVEFVEEFVKGYIQRNFPPVTSGKKTNLDSVNRILISGFETFPSNIVYSKPILSDVLLEYAERARLISHYNNFIDKTDNELIDYLVEAEVKNFTEGIISNSIDVPNFFKNTPITSTNVLGQVLTAKLGTSDPKYLNYQYGNVVTEYLANNIENTFDIYNRDLPLISSEITSESKIENYVKSTKNNFVSSTMTYPFVISEWNKSNLANGKETFDPSKVFNTNNSIVYNKSIKKIANYLSQNAFGNFGDKNSNRPLTNFKTLKNLIDITDSMSLSDFYDNRKSNDVFTEGTLENLSSLWKTNQTTSMLNTPFFINALQEGVENDRQNSNYAYTKAAYLFINSLPLATLRERYKISNGSAGNDLDYIASTFRKFGAVHAVPKLWIIKIGSIWNRYKSWIENGSTTDYMSSVFTNFNAAQNYDPINSDKTKQYTIEGAYLNSAYTFTLQSTISPQTNNTTLSSVVQNVGFYPKLLNDFYYFVNGTNIYSDNTTIETSINQKVSNAKVIFKNADSANILATQGDKLIDYKAWSIIIENELKSDSSRKYYVPTPSFGSVINQVTYEGLQPGSPSLVRTNFNFVDNQSIFNGSVRLLWGAPNYGFFQQSSVKIPTPKEYFKKIKTDEVLQNSFDFIDITSPDSYTNIEEIFSVFTKKELDIFEDYFKNFSQSSKKSVDPLTFQKILINALSIELVFDEITASDLNKQIRQVQNDQIKNFVNYLPATVNYDLIIKKGNPENFDYKKFYIFTDNPLLHSTDNLSTYVIGSLPVSGGTTTLAVSKNFQPEAWKALETYVGFSTISNLVYSDNGSYITDFFPDFNIGFTKENVQNFSEIIKIYATAKYNGFNKQTFKSLIIQQNLESKAQLENNILQSLDIKLKQGLPVYSEGGNYESKRDVTEGMQSKFEYYDMFKALNDKWVSGNNYQTETLFEDFLFFDRANKDIGNDIYVDIYKVKDYLKSVDPKTNLFVLVDSIIRDAHFVPFTMPAYINFYNIQRPGLTPKPYNPDEFANSLFGTYNTVDYQDSRTKYICQYADVPSNYLNNQDPANGYNDDGIYFEKTGNNTLIIDDSKKTDIDKALSNKVCGFVIDFGLQNQSVFEGIQISQDIGQATTESLKAEYDLANLSKGVSTTSQSVSLYNLYKQRSYGATVTCMGNAMIQPTMFFALRNVPLFSGTFLIDEVNHTITADSFRTTFTGTRQRVTTFPTVDVLLQSINKQILTSIQSAQKQDQQPQSLPVNNSIAANDKISANFLGNKPVADAQYCKPTPSYYQNYRIFNSFETESSKDVVLSAMTQLGIEPRRREIIYNLFAIGSWNGNSFKGQYYNYSEVSLDVPDKYGGSLNDLILNGFICLINKKNEQTPVVVFETLEKSIQFCDQKYCGLFLNVIRDNFGDSQSFANKFVEAYIQYFPYNKVTKDPQVYDKFLFGFPDDINYLRDIVRKNYNLFH